MLPTTIGALLLPKVAALDDEGARWMVTRKVALGTAALMLVVCGLAAIMARPAIGIIYGNEFLPSVTPLYWLLPGVVLLGVNTVFVHYFLAVGMPPAIVVAQAVAVVVDVVLALLLLRPHGLAGAGMAASIAYGALFAMTLAYVSRWRRRPR